MWLRAARAAARLKADGVAGNSSRVVAGHDPLMPGPDNISIDDAVVKPLAAGRRILWLGFGSLLLVMTLIGLDAFRSLERTTERSAALMKGFRERDQILDELREAMIQSGTILRDYLSESDVRSAVEEKARLEALRLRTEELLQAYELRLQAGQSEMFTAMRSGVRAYLKSLTLPLQWTADARAEKGEAYRRTAVGPLRTEVLRLRREITLLNENQLDLGEQQISAEHDKLRKRLMLAAAVAVLIGCLLAVVVMTRIKRLETAATAQYRRVVQARLELRGLAAKLDAAQEEERRSLSRELHDEVGQTMSALLMDLGKLEPLLPAEGPARSQLANARRLAENNVRAVRNMALLLRPSMLDDLGLVAALKWQGRETARRSGLKVSVDVDEAADVLPETHRTCIYRVVQEALNNVTRHAKATAARVLVRSRTAGVEVSVQDNGEGFDAAAKGAGMLGMQERVARLEGVLRVESRKGEGTVLTAVLPVRQQETVS
ncbi:MAG: histidine kinase [Bryobacteraceae bacterium]